MVVTFVLLTRVEFERGYAVATGLVVLPSWPVMGKTPYPDPRAVALVVKPLLKYGPSCRALDFVVCGTVVFDTRAVAVELWYDADTVDELPIEIVKPQAMPKPQQDSSK
jgi:hypothetical protein